MASIAETHTGPHDGGHHESYLTAKRGIASWLTTVDHKRIGVMYLASILFFFFVGGVAALLVRTELLNPGKDLVEHAVYNQLFTLHGAIMVFLFIVPSIPASLGNIVLPLMLGAKDVAFPKMNLASYYFYVVGAILFILTIVLGGLDTGWTFYAPYSTTTSTSVISATFGAFVLGFSSIFTGINFLVTIHKMRAPGMTWDRMPLMVWALYATSLIQVLATPVIAITLLLLICERTFGIGIFDPALGGDPVLFQHFFWFYSHPVVYVMILPGFGVISELVTVHSRKGIFGYMAIAISSVAIAFIGFLVWGHHMFVAGESSLAATVFSFLTFAVAVPTAIKVFSWIATMYGGSIRYTTPMYYVFVFLFLFSIGGLTGLFLGALAVDVQMHDTYFVVAHFHYVMMGGTFIAFLGGLFHWWPKFTGKMYDERLGKLSAVLVFIGFNVTFFTQFVLGSRGMPRRYYTYQPQFHTLHEISTIGSYILTAGLLVALVTFIKSLKSGEKATANPWNGMTLEWHTESPPIEHNFAEQPICRRGPYDFPEIDESAAGARH
ncbi:MAG: cytochrome c oxidase subunit I [Myxococcales bacterium]|nr:cytochrome c oxidase subunit I [Myxococcales bacterium]MCB9519341.1 cytochrome c oxidase subunit I [Myxococcales bacterium]MCB9530785.1 cytochrome c oxidase subunit I [Myxococcales bacterium]